MNKENVKTKVAIIGLGKIGETLAGNLVKGEQAVILASREFEKAQLLADKLGSLATAMPISDALQEADVVIPAIYFSELQEFLKTHATQLEGKILIDVSNPIAPDGKGGFQKVLGEQESAGQVLSKLLPKNSKLIKAFGTLGAGSLRAEAFATPERKTLFYASDSTNSHPIIEDLIARSGFAPIHVGGIDQSIRIEVFGDLHEFGKLGRTVTLQEAKKTLSNF